MSRLDQVTQSVYWRPLELQACLPRTCSPKLVQQTRELAISDASIRASPGRNDA
jgi:hypothetical protein